LDIRVILQSAKPDGSLGVIFDDDGVRPDSTNEAQLYDDGQPCYRLVSADGIKESLSEYLGFCCSKVVVTSRNLESKPNLKKWSKQASADRFVALPPSCLEVVYLLYVGPFN
jgi:hypothetical protein